MATETLLEKGIQNYRQENYEEALEIFTRAKSVTGDSAPLAYYLGLTHKQLGDLIKAAGYLKEAIGLDPTIPQAYTELIQILYNLADFQEAKKWLNVAEGRKFQSGLLSFLNGLILAGEGRNTEALAAFEEAKKLDPSLEAQASFQIAVIQTKERRYQKARETLKAVIAIDPAADLSNFAREYEQSLTRIVSKHQPWGGVAGAGYQYDDNVILYPSSAIPGLLITGEADSSILATFRLYYNPLLEGPWLFNAQYSLYSNTYFKVHSYDLINQTLSATPGYSVGRNTFTLPVLYSYVWLGGIPYQGVFSARPTWSFITFRDHLSQISAGYARRNVFTAPLMEDEDRDGNLLLGSASYIIPFWEKGILNLTYEYSHDMTVGKNWENRGQRLNLNLLVPISKTLSFTLSGEYFYQDYANINSVFEVKRLDKTYSGTIGLIWGPIKNLNVTLQYYAARAESNMAIYDYRRNVYTLGLEYFF